MTITIEKLKVGQRFSWIPAEWYGPCTLTRKRKCGGWMRETPEGWQKEDTYDLVYDAKVVNPPGVSYGVPGHTRVRLLKAKNKGLAR